MMTEPWYNIYLSAVKESDRKYVNGPKITCSGMTFGSRVPFAVRFSNSSKNQNAKGHFA